MELWRELTGYKFPYQVSNLGRVRNPDRKHNGGRLKPRKHSGGYLRVSLTLESGGVVDRYIHRLVAEAFLGFNPLGELEIDHKNRQREDNRLENLQIVTRGQNIRRTKGWARRKSKYKGVYYNKQVGKWFSQLHVAKGIRKSLGYFDSEEDAAQAYQAALKVY